jgi:hypothetical protein
MGWIAGYVLFSIALCLLTAAAHDIGEWLDSRPVTAWAVTIEYRFPVEPANE